MNTSGATGRVYEVRGDWPGFVIVAREDFARAHATLLERSLAVLRSEAMALREDQRSVELVMRNAGFNEELAREWLGHVRWHVAPPRPGELVTLIRTLRELELTPVGARVDPLLSR